MKNRGIDILIIERLAEWACVLTLFCVLGLLYTGIRIRHPFATKEQRGLKMHALLKHLGRRILGEPQIKRSPGVEARDAKSNSG